MPAQILYRSSNPYEDSVEIEAAKQAGFNVIFRRTDCKPGLVISRYSCLPYFKELEEDLKVLGANLINSYSQHKYIADFEYYHDIEEFTAKTYFALDHIEQPIKKGQKFVLKGKTNSKKQKWNTLMLAEGWSEVVRIYCELSSDELIGPQGVIIREYLPLKQLGKSDITGIPFTNEHRVWFLGSKMLHHSYYWSIAPDEVISSANINLAGKELAQKVANIISKRVNFFVLDIAEKEDGSWCLIEVNDGQCSGLPFDSDILMYSRLAEELKVFSPI